MRKVLAFSLLLLLGLAGSQLVPSLGEPLASQVGHGLHLLTMVGLAFIMVHVGLEFDLDKAHPRRYGWDYVVAATAATFPWLLVALYLVLVLAPPAYWSDGELWKGALLQARFAAPTSAGILFSMLAAAGLGATWVFRKARVLAIFDDLDTILLMVPLTFLLVGFRWQLLLVLPIMGTMLWVAWRFLHRLRLPYSWSWVLGYSVVLVAASEAISLTFRWIDPEVPVALEVLLPAFALGCVISRPAHGITNADATPGQQPGPDSRREQQVATLVSGAFMLLVGLSMPAFRTTVAPAEDALGAARAWAAASPWPGWGWVAVHVLALTLLSNVGKMFPLLCYRKETGVRERLALCVCLFPRGEVGAGVLVVALSYGLGGVATTVALLSLALNLLLTGMFILWVRRLLAPARRAVGRQAVARPWQPGEADRRGVRSLYPPPRRSEGGV
jgi:Kef-type K+ transport system membrane component KefB